MAASAEAGLLMTLWVVERQLPETFVNKLIDDINLNLSQSRKG